MDNRIKNGIGVAAIVGVVFLAYAMWVYVSAYAKSTGPDAYRTFSVSAQGEVLAIPDVAEFSFSVITQGGANIANLQTQNVEKVNRALAFVKAQGVEDKDVKTQQFSLEPRYQHFSCSRPAGNEAVACPPSEIVGYTITQTVQVKVRDFAKIGTMVSGVVENGANSVSQLSFTIDNPDLLENEARSKAMEKARSKAEAVAKAGNFKLGKLLSILEGDGFVYPLPEQAFDKGFGGAAAAPVIEPGSQDVKVFMTLVYEIQ